ncbi:hypothetical protein QVD17_15918 [Tagetes erecta]|uniref:Uncharacterized protein n=1 Tax=Tagetes erecta TaxID=13708 RepID=A0AAD8KQ18_TARER|nr:hypothetical protein QVD17_15918 [Tagetes erecta]
MYTYLLDDIVFLSSVYETLNQYYKSPTTQFQFHYPKTIDIHTLFINPHLYLQITSLQEWKWWIKFGASSHAYQLFDKLFEREMEKS